MRIRTGGVLPLIAGFAVLASGCDFEVLNPGSILDEDLNTPALMPILVAGASAELNDVIDTYSFWGGTLTDDMSGTGSYFTTGQFRLGRFDDDDSEGFWEQNHEAAWAAGEAWSRLELVLEGGANTTADAARLFYIMGTAHVRLGENFCDLVYDKGPIQPREAAFDSALIQFNRAITIGGASGSQGATYIDAGNGGKAQAYVGLGDWASAVDAAGKVPTDFVIEAIYHSNANTNQIYQETWRRAEQGVWATPVQRIFNPTGDGDPRVPFTICGAWNDTNDPPDPSLGVTSTGVCTGQGSGAHQGAGGLTAHYRQDKYPERGSDIPTIKGTEMRLIEAENALRGDDIVTFKAKIDEVRAFYGADPQDWTAIDALADWRGGLEWENAEDDGWSIMDRERYLTNWIEGRRIWDLFRWDHPFLNGGTLIGPGEPRRMLFRGQSSCMPIPEIECTLNENIADSFQCTG